MAEIFGDHVRLALTWLLASGLRLLLIVVVTLIALRLIRVSTEKLRTFLQRLPPESEQQKQAETLYGIVRATATFLLLLLAAMLMLRELGVSIAPIIATAGIGGLAVGFGAQNLIRDVITGFFILLEGQIRVGDVVQAGDKSGLVESLGLRTLILRDLEGNVHIVPNGTIAAVTNMTKEFAYALVDVGVSYHANVDEVMAVLQEVGVDMRRDTAFASDILEELEILGVNDLADSAVVIRIRIKTRPIQQWRVGRELRRRIIKAFAARGIDIPFPHRTLYIGEPKQGHPTPLRIVVIPDEGSTARQNL